MTRRVLPALLVTLLVLAARGVTAQQSASDLLAQGIGAYQNLDYDQAATVLRRGLARTTDTLSTADRLRASLQEKELLLKEIHHRVKNNLQIVSSLLNLQAESVPSSDARESLLESQARVRAMALLHETLYQSNSLGGVDFAAYLESLWAYLARTIGGLHSRLPLS